MKCIPFVLSCYECTEENCWDGIITKVVYRLKAGQEITFEFPKIPDLGDTRQ